MNKPSVKLIPDKPNYLSVASEAIGRGLAFTPVTPGTKEGELYGWNRHPSTTLSEAVQHAKDFPNHSAAIVGKGRGIDNLMFFDDDSGIASRIEHETHQELPTLCVVRTRPDSAPEKAHYYFKQTAYSMKTLPRVQTNVTDLTRLVPGRKNNRIHPTLYDLKAIGKAGFVIAPGSSRPNKIDPTREEFYTTGWWTFEDIPPIPEWLVDWFAADIHRHKSEQAKMLAKARQERLKTPHAAEVSDAESYVWIKGRAKSFASLGVDRKDIDTLLAHQAIKFCEGGKAVFEADKWKKRFHKLAFDPKLVIGHAVRQGTAGYYDKDNKFVLWDHTPLKPPSTHSILVKAMLTYPDLIWADDMYRKIEKLRPDYITRDKRGDLTTTAKRRAGRAGDEAGYVPEQPPGQKGRWRWVRNAAGFTGVAPPTLYTLSIGETRYALLCATRSNIDTRSTMFETALLWQAFKKYVIGT